MSTGLPRAWRLASVKTHRPRRHAGEPWTPRSQRHVRPASLLLTEAPLVQGPGAQLRPHGPSTRRVRAHRQRGPGAGEREAATSPPDPWGLVPWGLRQQGRRDPG